MDKKPKKQKQSLVEHISSYTYLTSNYKNSLILLQPTTQPKDILMKSTLILSKRGLPKHQSVLRCFVIY